VKSPQGTIQKFDFQSVDNAANSRQENVVFNSPPNKTEKKKGQRYGILNSPGLKPPAMSNLRTDSTD
jgi:hypothetical protein